MASVAHFFYFDRKRYEKEAKKVMDVTGIELTPGNPAVCLGNGEQGFECCCDECDYFLQCFPEYDIKDANA